MDMFLFLFDDLLLITKFNSKERPVSLCGAVYLLVDIVTVDVLRVVAGKCSSDCRMVHTRFTNR